MRELWISFLNMLQEIGDASGCHQMPERSLHVGNYTFPVCARCTGVAFGQGAAVIGFFAGIRVKVLWCLAFLGIMGADWLLQEKGYLESTNGRRLITGFLGGFGLFSLYGICLRAGWRLVKKMFCRRKEMEHAN